jgi:outer membrane murein-binding lipoprotein Lpp
LYFGGDYASLKTAKGRLMRQKNLFWFLGIAALGLCVAGCNNSKTVQENQQLKTQVAELQKENGQLGNDVETLTAARDELTKENGALQSELKAKRPAPKAKTKAAKAETRKRKKSHKLQQS